MSTTELIVFFCYAMAFSFFTMLVLGMRAYRIYNKHSGAMIDALFGRDIRQFKKDWANGKCRAVDKGSRLCDKYVLADKYRKRHIRRLTFFIDPWDIYPPDIQYITKLELGINERWAERRFSDWKHIKSDPLNVRLYAVWQRLAASRGSLFLTPPGQFGRRLGKRRGHLYQGPAQ